jgi:putative phage-type endonuclease
MAELIPTASEAEWLEARRRGITASEIAVVMGLSPYSSPYALYHQKLGILPPDGDQAVFERGRVLEPYIAEKFAAAHPEFIVDGTGRELYAHAGRTWQLATPDRLLQDAATCGLTERDGVFEVENVAVLETKTDAGDEWGDEGSDDIPVHYRCQVLWQMDVMGVDRAHVACLRMRQWDIREYVIGHGNCFATEASERIGGAGPCDACKDQRLMRDAARDFLDRLGRQEPPDVDWRPATIGALKQLHPSLTDETAEIGPQLADRYEAACRNYKRAEQKKKLYEARVREVMGSARRAARTGPGQVPVARRDVYEVREHVRKASTTDKLVPTPPRPKKESNEHADSK